MFRAIAITGGGAGLGLAMAQCLGRDPVWPGTNAQIAETLNTACGLETAGKGRFERLTLTSSGH